QEQPLTSPDRTMRIFLAVTNQTSVSAFECQRLMRRVNEFRAAAGEGWEGDPLQILITGRPAFVSEISLSMRYDVVATLLGSVALVGAIFFGVFRSLGCSLRSASLSPACLCARSCFCLFANDRRQFAMTGSWKS